MIRVNRYRRGPGNGKWYWRVWRGSVCIARGIRGFRSETAMERDLKTLFPHWVNPKT